MQELRFTEKRCISGDYTIMLHDEDASWKNHLNSVTQQGLSAQWSQKLINTMTQAFEKRLYCKVNQHGDRRQGSNLSPQQGFEVGIQLLGKDRLACRCCEGRFQLETSALNLPAQELFTSENILVIKFQLSPSNLIPLWGWERGRARL